MEYHQEKESIPGLKIGFCGLGCAKNQVDSEVMLGKLKAAGFEIGAKPEDSDVIVVNTCGFIEEAKEESIDTILEMARHKETGRCRRLVVAGCLSQRNRTELLKSIPEIDACLGIDEMDRIVDACAGTFKPSSQSPLPPSRVDPPFQARARTTPRHFAYLKVADGCDHLCSFCVIPKIRGQYRSRPVNEIVEEAERLIDDGAVELNLVAQDLGPYGNDIGIENGLPVLLRSLTKLDGLRWLRLLYVYPEGLSYELLSLISNESKILPYLDIPLQHASSRVLKSMGRPGSGKTALKKIAKLRKSIPGLAIRTSMIVGFPTESQNDFDELVQFVSAAQFDHLGVFTYSHEEGSIAFKDLKDRWPAEVKADRRDRIMRLQHDISLNKHEEMIGSRRKCLVEGIHPESELLLSGRLPTQAPESDGMVIINEGTARPGDIVTVEITEAHPYDLVGKIIDAG